MCYRHCPDRYNSKCGWGRTGGCCLLFIRACAQRVVLILHSPPGRWTPLRTRSPTGVNGTLRGHQDLPAWPGLLGHVQEGRVFRRVQPVGCTRVLGAERFGTAALECHSGSRGELRPQGVSRSHGVSPVWTVTCGAVCVWGGLSAVPGLVPLFAARRFPLVPGLGRAHGSALKSSCVEPAPSSSGPPTPGTQLQ